MKTTRLESSPNASLWFLTGLLLWHVWLIAPDWVLFGILGAGPVAGLFLQNRRMLPWVSMVGLIGLAGGALLVFLIPVWLLPGALALWVGGIQMLRPLSPLRGLIVLYCVVLALAVSVLQIYPPLVGAPLVINVLVIFFTAQLLHQPPEAAGFLRGVFLRSLGLAVPVGLIVAAFFLFFPGASGDSGRSTTGFAATGILNPGQVASMRLSNKVAFVARIDESGDIPAAEDLFWRGEVFEKNEGLRWSRTAEPRPVSDVSDLRSLGHNKAPRWNVSYLRERRKPGNLPVLEMPVLFEFLTDSTDGTEPALFVRPDGIYSIGAGAQGEVRMLSTKKSASDHPANALYTEHPQGWLPAPPDPRAAELMKILTAESGGLLAILDALGGYFSTAGFSYSATPGSMDAGDVWNFLFQKKRGFCEHYAAAAANLLRVGGIPARVVGGYQGGEWNPWRRTLTVRDSDAHAWVEAWDAKTKQWVRFDPTRHVAPELALRAEMEMNPSQWPLHQWLARRGGALFLDLSDQSRRGVAWVVSAAGRHSLWRVAIPALLAAVLLGYILRVHRNGPVGRMRLKLSRLERRMAGGELQRNAGESPLAWLERLAAAAPPGSREEDGFRVFAGEYDRVVYAPDASRERLESLRHPWNNRPPFRLLKK